MTEFPDLAPWAERQRQRLIDEARQWLSEETDWSDEENPPRRLGTANALIESLLDELEGTGE